VHQLHSIKEVHFICILHRADRAEVLPSRFAGSRRDASRALGGIARDNAIQVLCAKRKSIPPIDYDYPKFSTESDL